MHSSNSSMQDCNELGSLPLDVLRSNERYKKGFIHRSLCSVPLLRCLFAAFTGSHLLKDSEFLFRVNKAFKDEMQLDLLSFYYSVSRELY